MTACRVEVHHRVPRCLLGFFDGYVAGDLDGEGFQAWYDWEEEAFRYGVDPDVTREELEVLIEASTSPVPATEHRANHSLVYSLKSSLRGGRWLDRNALEAEQDD